MPKLSHKKTLIAAIVAVLVILVGVTAFWLNPLFLQGTVNAKAPPAGYIGNSKIYLLSTNSSYSEYKGSQCFIIQVTVRNDYTAQNPPDNLTSVKTGSAWLILSAKVYDDNNTQIEAQPYLPPNSIASYNQQCIGSGETLSYDVYLTVAQQRQDIDHYELVFSYLGSIPAP